MITAKSVGTEPRRQPRWFVTLGVVLPAALFSLGALAMPANRALAGPGGDPESPAAVGRFDHHRMRRLLDLADASADQRTRIKAVWKDLRPQLQALREQRQSVRADLRKALAAPSIDPAAVERLRQQEVQLADKSSALFTQGIVQSAQVLTPEQRQKIAAQLEQRRKNWRRGE